MFGRHVRVRGEARRYDKVLAHLMFGMTVLTASELMRLIVPPILVRLVSFAITRGRTSPLDGAAKRACSAGDPIPNRRLCQR